MLILEFFLVDDAWYYLEVAQRAAVEGRLTFDGLNTTNGFHPLWMVFLSVFALIGMTGPGAALIAQLGLTAVGAFARARSAFELGALLAVLASFHGLKIFLNGMESALAFALVAWVLHLAESRAPTWVFGLLTGLAVTARWTNVALLAPLLFFTLRTLPVRNWAVVLAAATAPIAAALGSSWALTGHLIPVSAAIKTGQPAGPFVFLLCAVVLGLTGAFAWKRRNDPARDRVFASFALGVAIVMCADFAFRRMVIAEIWTLWPQVLLLMLAATRLPKQALGVAAVLASVTAIWSWQHRLNPESSTAYEAATRSGEWLEANTAPTTIAAGWDVGFIAGHTSRAVVNLDGLVNSWEFKEQVLDRGRLETYLHDELKPQFVAQDVPVSFLRRDKNVAFKGASLAPWYVRRAECFFFRAATSPWIRQHKVALVLSREPFGEDDRSLSDRRLELCADRG